MPFMLRTYRRFLVHCAVTYNAGPFQGQGTIWNLSCTAGDPRLSRIHCEIVITDSIPNASFDLELIGNPGSP